MNFSETIKKYYPDVNFDDDGRVINYSSPKEEYKYIRHGAGIRSISGFKTYRLSGKDTVEFVGRLSTNDVSRVNEGAAVNTVFTNAKGRIIDRTKFVRSGEEYLLLSARRDNALQYWLEKYVIMEDLKVEDISDSFGKFKLLGSQAESFLTFLIGDEVEKLESGQAVVSSVKNTEVILIKDEYEGKLSAFYLIFDINSIEALLESLLAEDNVFDVGFVGEDAYRAFRIESGRPAYPNEINDNYNPHEINLTGEISFTKGCYIGQEVVARLETYDKVQKRLTGVVFSNSHLPETNAEIVVGDGTEVGKVTSCAHSMLSGKNIGLAVIRNEYAEQGTQLSTQDGSEFTVVGLPMEL